MALNAREDVRGTTGQDIGKINDNFRSIWKTLFGGLDYADMSRNAQKKIRTQTIPVQGEGNFDVKYPMNIRFYIPSDVEEIKQAKLNFICERYRMDSSVTKGGGGFAEGNILLSIASGGGYAGASGGYGSTTTQYVKAWGTPPYTHSAPSDYLYTTNVKAKNTSGGYVTSNDNRNTLGSRNMDVQFLTKDGNENNRHTPGYISYADMRNFQHSHDVSIPNHSHSINISPHTHSGKTQIQIPAHEHNLKEGIYIASTPANNVVVRINGQAIITDLNSDASNIRNDVDVSSHIRIGDWNIVTIEGNLGRMSMYGIIDIITKY